MIAKITCGWLLLASALSLAVGGCGNSGQTPNRATVVTHAMHGVIESLDAQGHTATIKHEKIQGFMEAMTMEYAVKDLAEYAKLRKGETIDAKLYVQDTDYWIGEIREAK